MFIIGKQIIKTAPPCALGRVCLSGDLTCCCSCSVKQDEGDYLLVEVPEIFNISTCSYSKKIEDGDPAIYVCSCPVRLEIYRKYRK